MEIYENPTAKKFRHSVGYTSLIKFATKLTFLGTVTSVSVDAAGIVLLFKIISFDPLGQHP